MRRGLFVVCLAAGLGQPVDSPAQEASSAKPVDIGSRRELFGKLAASRFRLRNPFGEEPYLASGATVRRQGNDLFVDLAKGQEIILRLHGEPLRFDEAAKGARQGDVSRIGLH